MEEKNKTDKQIKIIIYVLIGLLIVLVAYVYLTQQKVTPGTYKYKDFEIQQIDEGTGISYKIKLFIGEDPTAYYINTRYDPEQVEDIPSEDINDKIIGKKEVFIVIDPYANLTGQTTLAALEIDKFIDNRYLFNIPVNSAFTEDYQNMTVKTCGNANNETAVIWLKLGDETRIYSDKECVILEGKTQEDLIKLATLLNFKLLKIVD